MTLAGLRKLFIQTLVGSLIAAAALAVIAVLLGGFTDILGRTLGTILIVAAHSIVGLGIVHTNENQNDAQMLNVFTNTSFVIVVLSFITSVFGIWELLPGELVGRLYLTYLVILFATLHGEMLAKSLNKEAYIDKIVWANYGIMAVVVALILPVIYIEDASVLLGDFYFRLLTAFAIVDATLTILAMIFYKVYLQKHPKVESPIFYPAQVQYDAQGKPVPFTPAQPPKRGTNPLLIILGLFLLVQVVLPVMFLIFSFLT